jgi:hypothetical protein
VALMRELFNVKLLIALVVAGVLAFAAFILLSVYADDFRGRSDGRGHALSVSAIGFQGIVRLVELSGGKTKLLRSEATNDSDDLLVTVLEPQVTEPQLEKLLYDRPKQPVLVVLPKWMAVQDPRHRGWVRVIGHFNETAAISALGDVKLSVDQKDKGGAIAEGAEELEGIQAPVPRQPQTISGKDVVPLLKAPGGGALVARIKNIPVVADPDLLNNHGMKDPRTARAAMLMLSRFNSPDAKSVVFDVSLNGFGRKPSVYKLAFEPPYLTLTLALFVAALLAGLHGAFRFGPAAHEKRAIAFGKLALVENSAGLIQLARREHRAGGAYADVVRDSAARASGAPPTLQGEALDAYLDKLSAKTDTSFTSLAQQARDAGDRYELLRAARALFQWKKDNIR